jgi:hypothetical protein
MPTYADPGPGPEGEISALLGLDLEAFRTEHLGFREVLRVEHVPSDGYDDELSR